MTYFKLLLIATGLILGGVAQAQSEEGQESLDDVVVKETFEAGAEEEKLPIIIKSDFTNLVEIRERINWSSLPWTFGETSPAFELFESKISYPGMAQITPAPAKVFQLDFKNLSRWSLDIFASDGSKFRGLTGEGDPPKTISWDGRGDSGKPLIPGEKYSYSFTAVDKAGNRRTFPGESFSAPALFLATEEGIWIGLSNDLIFSPHGYGLSGKAEQYSKELLSLIYYYCQEGAIRIQSKHPDTEKFLELLGKKLGVDAASFRRVDASLSPEDCFVMWIN